MKKTQDIRLKKIVLDNSHVNNANYLFILIDVNIIDILATLGNLI